jgi:hypothetical protein
MSVHKANVRANPRDILRASMTRKASAALGRTQSVGPLLGRVVKVARMRLVHRRDLRDDGGESGTVASPYRIKWLSAQIAAVYYAREQALRQVRQSALRHAPNAACASMHA